MRPHLRAATLDDLMRKTIELLLREGEEIEPTKGPALELFGCTLELSNPRARLSRSAQRGRIFSALGELCWYLAGSDRIEPIEYYIPIYRDFAEPDGVVHGAYGPRLFNFDGVDQVSGIIETLKRNPFSRKAVIQLFDHDDTSTEYRDVPCTCCVQFLIRNGALQAITYMRSNDVYAGIPHDFFAFTMLQEIVARTLDLDVGEYLHLVGSLHLYRKDEQVVRKFLDEGWQSSDPVMPAMPAGDPWISVRELLNFEEQVRLNNSVDVGGVLPRTPYWADLAILLEAFAGRRDKARLESVLTRLHCAAFRPYIREKLDALGA